MTRKQIEAQRKKFRESTHTVVGRFAKGQIVADRPLPCAAYINFFKIETIGFHYHEDVSSRIYGAKKIRPSRKITATIELQQIISDILKSGERGKCPGESKTATWDDRKLGSLAQPDNITLYGSYICVTRPIYDDAPIIAWVHDAKLALKAQKAINASPEHIAYASVKTKGEANGKEKSIQG